jgi:SecD/SecF fusion protein
MRLGVAALGIAFALAGAPAGAQESACGQALRLSIDPVDKAADVAATLRRRLAAAGAVAPKVEAEGPGRLRAVLPPGANETLFTRPARIEFRLVAATPDEAGAVPLPRLDGKGTESVSPEIILDESHLREARVRMIPNAAGGPPDAALAFHFDPHAMKNLMAATTEAVGRKLAILIDDEVVADPVIRAPIASVTGEIPAGALPSASELVDLLRNGRLSARVTVIAREPAPCGTH